MTFLIKGRESRLIKVYCSKFGVIVFAQANSREGGSYHVIHSTGRPTGVKETNIYLLYPDALEKYEKLRGFY